MAGPSDVPTDTPPLSFDAESVPTSPELPGADTHTTMPHPSAAHTTADDIRGPQILSTADLADPPPPYPVTRRQRRRRREQPSGASLAVSATDGDDTEPFPAGVDGGAGERTPLLRPRPIMRTRTMSGASTARSVARSVASRASIARTAASLFSDTYDSEPEDDTRPAPPPPATVEGAPLLADGDAPGMAPTRAGRWRRYFRPLTRRAFWAALFHLLVLNFPYALVAWLYLFVFTVTGTALLITLPLGVVFCFLNIIGARLFARGELAMQIRFHGPLAYRPSPPHAIFTRMRNPPLLDAENGCALGPPEPDPSFYRNTYAMFADPTSYRALFYFLVIKPSITLLLTIALLVLAPVCVILVLPAPAFLRAVRRIGVWQANLALEGLYASVSW